MTLSNYAINNDSFNNKNGSKEDEDDNNDNDNLSRG